MKSAYVPAIIQIAARHRARIAGYNPRAAKGVLVTTSWGRQGEPQLRCGEWRIEIIDGRNLRALLKECLGLDVLIGLEKPPPGWTTSVLGQPL